MRRLKYISAKEFLEKGYLQEVNRRFFNPLGLSMVIEEYANGKYRYAGIADFRDIEEPLSMLFDQLDDENFEEATKWKENVDNEIIKRADVRIDVLGSIIEEIKR